MAGYYFPKCLLPVAQRPMLLRIIECWEDAVDQVVLVVNPGNEQILRTYVSTYYSGNAPVRFVVQPRPTGTYDAVRLALRSTSADRAILNWSDICLHATPIQAQDTAANIVLTTDLQDHCRWVFSDGQFSCRAGRPFSGGGVFGVMLLNNLSQAFRKDFCAVGGGETEILSAFDNRSFRNFTCEDFTDIGERSRYASADRVGDRMGGGASAPRAFGSGASIEFGESVVVKKFRDEQMRENEIGWYLAAGFPFLPKVHSTDPLTLERIDAEPCWQRLQRDPSPQTEAGVIRDLARLARTMHASRGRVRADVKSCQRQYLDKTIERLERVDVLFQGFNRSGFSVNSRELSNPLDMLRRHEPIVQNIYPDWFHFIHGDLQLSNSLIDDRDRLWLIDPRGSFGGTPLYGDALYDFAKLYYGFCGGYDLFSTGRNNFTVSGERSFAIDPLVPPAAVARRRELFAREIERTPYLRRGMAEIDLVHSLIWLSVADYMANDVLSSMYAYLHGTMLLTDALAAMKTLAELRCSPLSAAA